MDEEVAVQTHILLVDDVEDNLTALEALVRRPSVNVLKALSANDALELLLQYDVALALLDVQMPEMDGLQLAELMRGAARTRNVPIIFLTAGAQDSRRTFRGYESGAVDFLYKPIDAQVLRSKVGVFVELNEQKQRLAQALEAERRARMVAEAATRARDELTAIVSHDLRNPLGAVLMAAGVLRNLQGTDPRSARNVEIIHRSAGQMNRLIGDLLDLATLEAGHLKIDVQPQNVSNLLGDAFEQFKPLVTAKGLRWNTRPAPSGSVVCDRQRILQILSNLVGNATKFTPEGGSITLSADNVGEEVRFSVTDTGQGISAENLPHVFDRYWQAKNRGRVGGVGLGLAIVYGLVQAHGGRVWAESTVGVGTTFSFTLKRA